MPTSASVAASGARRCSRGRRWSRRTCPISPRSCRSSTSSRSSEGEDVLDRHSRRRVDFESLDFNRRFIATVPADHDPVALRELFSPAFLDWTTRIDATVDFGITEGQLFFLWRLRELSSEELVAALKAAGGIFARLRNEMEEHGLHTYQAGPWHAGLEPFPSQ